MKNSILPTLFLIFLTACTTSVNKEKLVAHLIDMRTIPTNLIEVTKIGNYEIAYQDKNTFSDRYNYPDNYAIAKLNAQENDYEYVTYIKGISPIKEFKYVTTILESFKTDSTYISAIIKEKDSIRANVYRKTNQSAPKFLMWKWVKAPYKTQTFKTIEFMNKHRLKR